MAGYSFVHAADLHLDTPFEGIRASAPAVADALRDASLDAFDALVTLTLESDAAFLLLAGDLYDGPERGLRAQLRFRRGLERLSEAEIPVFIVHGNHDPLDEGWSAVREWPAGVTVFGSDAVDAAPVERDGRRIATVYGRSYARAATRDNLSRGYHRGPEPGLHIGVLHCNAGDATDHAPYSPCTLQDLVDAGMDYWALGHIHRHSILRSGDPWIVYPGCLQGRSPHLGELGPKGAVVVSVEERSGVPVIVGARHAPLDRVRFCELKLDAEAFSEIAELEVALEADARALQAEAGGRALVVRAHLTGRSEMYADLRRAGAAEELLLALRDTWVDSEPFLWWESLANEVRPVLDREEMRRRSDFAGELLAVSGALGQDGAALAGFADEQLHGLAGRLQGIALPTLGEDELASLFEEGEALALELLGADEME